MLTDSTIARPLDALSLAPSPETVAIELLATVADNVFGNPHPLPLSRKARGVVLRVGNCASQEGAHGFAIRLARERRNAHHSPGKMVDNDCYPMCEGVGLWQRERQPTGPESASRHSGEIDVPDVVAVLGRNDAFCRVRLGLAHERFMPRLLLEHPADSRRSQVQARPGKRLGDLDLAQRRANGFQKCKRSVKGSGVFILTRATTLRPITTASAGRR